MTISVYGSRLKGDKVKFRIYIFLWIKVPRKLFTVEEEEVVETAK